jgi:isopentenyl-diphosphate delta-isomerase
MTAGHEEALSVNKILALACQERGWAMGVGSQRRELEMGRSDLLDCWKSLRRQVPDLILFANIGLSQLIRSKVSRVEGLIQELKAQALVVHLNALQEVIQKEGTPFFRGGFDALRQYCDQLSVPIVVKETGCGFSRETLKKLASLPLAAVDVSGLGGTHWGRVEGARAEAGSLRSIVSRTFANWGESTAQSVLCAKEIFPKQNGQPFRQVGYQAVHQAVHQQRVATEIWASGGVRTGLDAAKLIALGADRVGYAKPALEAALKGVEQLRFWMETQEYELKVALFCTGSKTCDVLRQKEEIWKVSAI